MTASQLSASTRPMSGALSPAWTNVANSPGSSLVAASRAASLGRIEDGGAKGKGAPIGQSHEVAGGHEPHDRAPRIGYGEVLHARVEHVECGIHRISIRPDGQERAAHDRGDRRFGRDPASHHLLTEVGVGHDAELAARRDQQRRDVVRAHQARGFSHRSFRRAEHRWPRHEVADADGADLRQAVDGVSGAGEPLAHGPGNEYGPGGSAKNFQRLLPPDQVAGGVFVRPDGECRRHARQQRRVAEALSGLEDVHHLILVAQLDRAAADDEKLGRRGAVLDQNVGACGVGADRDRRGDAQQIVPAELIEWGERGEETGNLFQRCLCVGRIPELARSEAQAGSYDHDRWAKGHKKARGKAPLRCKNSISTAKRARAVKRDARLATSAEGDGRQSGARPAIRSSGFALAFDGRATLVLDVDPVPIEGQVGEQRRPAKPVIDLDIAQLRVPQAAEQPEDEVDRRQESERRIS